MIKKIDLKLLVLVMNYDIPAHLGSIVVSIFIITVFALFAFMLDFIRMFIYGLMFGISELVWGFPGEGFGIYAFLIFGCISFIIGLTFLTRFIYNNPLPDPEVVNA